MQSPSTPLRWGMIGAGDVAEVKSGPALYKTAGSTLVAVMRRNPERAQDYARRHGVERWSTRAEDILQAEDIDAVYIATPPDSHKDYTLAALAAGKHVYVEKPVALNTRECDAMMAAEQASTASVCVAHYRRFLPIFARMKSLLDSGAIGRPLVARLDMLQPAGSDLIAASDQNWRVDPAIAGGGLFHDLAPHQLDLLLHWFGPVVRASGFGINQGGHYPADDCVHGWAELAQGVAFQGRWHFAMPETERLDLCEIIGTEGRLSINFFGEQCLTLDNGDGQQTFRIPNPPHIQQPMIEQVLRYWREGGDNPCSLAEARAVTALMDDFTR
ncbi:Gfo/Idh/MocA family protein [Marinimicrobium alkaliphilum]|uniref:Gfo/Idh/MocA family protein n=1 Tax=Marinimicrobium alkaliphilum TaxID=2202654 RepID=UPI000DBA1FC5|nr:Gfo/Idh/MocA family oxidoreductase [Marinimicrobium alkaliphilum]